MIFLAEFKVIFVETEYDLNLGYAARILSNFGQKEMVLVNPKAKTSFEAQKFAKHGLNLLLSAKRFSSIGEAAKDCDFIVGTSGILIRSRSTLRAPVPLRNFAESAKKKRGKFAVLVGREGTGLTAEELKICDFLVTIPVGGGYPILNITHALAIILYELAQAGQEGEALSGSVATKKELEQLKWLYGEIVDGLGKEMRDKGKAKLAFKRLVGRAIITDMEARTVIGVLAKAGKKLGRLK
ncbi:23S rRNA (guanosine-2'-O-)-methyltransferase RlmB [uncultured archaeon]|nr:23S rRNA (guanosine-2'-O-)-methyltransferase RlmB [uncultured archaeon]